MREKKVLQLAYSNQREAERIENILVRTKYKVLTSSTAKDTVSLASKQRPDMLLLSKDMPGRSVVTLIKNIRKCLDAPIILLLSQKVEKTIIMSLDAGAHDVFIEPFGTAEHQARIRAHLRNKMTNAGADIFSVDGLEINFKSRMISVNDRAIHLTPIEFRILSLLSKNAGKVLTHEQIINDIWGPYNSDSLVLRVNMSNIRKKIEKDPTIPKYILTEAGVGYKVCDNSRF